MPGSFFAVAAGAREHRTEAPRSARAWERTPQACACRASEEASNAPGRCARKAAPGPKAGRTLRSRAPKLCAAPECARHPCATLRETFPGQSVNQLAFAIGALAGLAGAGTVLLFLRLLRPAAPAWLKSYDATHLAAFEQWPTTALVLDPASERVLAVNPAGLRSLGYTLDEVRTLAFSALFSVEGVDAKALVKRLQESSSRAPVEMRQRCKDGATRTV